MRTDEGRRRELKLSNLRYERDRVAHARDLLQIRLAAAITTHRDGWHAPAAVALKREIGERASDWAKLNEAVRAILQDGS